MIDRYFPPRNSIKGKVSFSESGSYLLIHPVAIYPEGEYSVLGYEWRAYDKEDDSREWDKEWTFAEQLAALHPDLNSNTNLEFFQLKIKEALSQGWFIDFCQYCHDNGIEVSYDNLQKINLNPSKAKIDYQLSSGIDWVDFKVDVSFNNMRVSIKELKRAILKNERQLELEDGTIGYISNEWLAMLQPIFLVGKQGAERVRLKKNQWPALNELERQTGFAAETKAKIAKVEIDKVEKVPLPNGIIAVPRPYQQCGYEWLVTLSKLGLGACLADDMGLGKTLQMLMYITWYLEQESQAKKVLIICPTSLLFNWENEVKKFAPKLKVYIHWGNKRTKDEDTFEAYDIVLTTYGVLMSDIPFLQKIHWGILTLDESQTIKTPSSQRTHCAKQLIADHRCAMTGTPIENNAYELWSQMDFINPGLLGSFYQFQKNFKDVLGQVRSPQKAEYLRQLVKPYILRRVKSQVASELPEKTEMVLHCDMESEQRKAYDEYRALAYKKVKYLVAKAEEAGSRFSLLSYLFRLRQLCNSTHLFNLQNLPSHHSIKIKMLMVHINEKHSQHKILVFTQFLGMIDEIAKALEGENIGYCQLTGSTKNRQELVESFESDASKRVFLISIKAGGTGLNLTSADYVYIVDPWWNPAVENQAIDRAYRIGQTKKVMAYRMIATNTIEEKIQKLQKQKQQLSDEIITTEEGFMKQLSRADFVDLLE